MVSVPISSLQLPALWREVTSFTGMMGLLLHEHWEIMVHCMATSAVSPIASSFSVCTPTSHLLAWSTQLLLILFCEVCSELHWDSGNASVLFFNEDSWKLWILTLSSTIMSPKWSTTFSWQKLSAVSVSFLFESSICCWIWSSSSDT